MTTPNPCDKPGQPYGVSSGAPMTTSSHERIYRPLFEPWTEPKPYPPEHMFWMIYVEGKQAPAKRHYQYIDALAEAERLAGEEPGRRVYLLPAERYCLVRLSPVEWCECAGDKKARR